MSNELLRWRKEATTDEWCRLASLAKTSVGYLDQIAYGFRRASSEKAYAIEEATKKFSHHAPVTKENLVFAPKRASHLSSTHSLPT
ncbi:transcriptional regulator [Cronobacter sakazakii]|uniref:transcriptional regulator n=1 Tax=Cronobacter sakazakii TaxID=28141 RepID=UPI0008FBDA8B|nr:transcriptional regulator [Cronobacter sakazakii]EGT4238724.1 transcriptional regulator [Cronobacter sakazakii]EGT4259658.1 transcriptional regulator [Cronobacter sakazakii]EGT4271732.1 transcriptional regulator [Cronobacter sakazakii]EGT4302280.1 transcriptional regulator [Cronobacter sakazakii]EGT4328645.1 transcriptional regulator [Cronobacter sakazakii]